jgi:hypothetical protein
MLFVCVAYVGDLTTQKLNPDANDCKRQITHAPAP